MDAENVRALIAAAMSTGTGVFQSWRVDFRENRLEISHNGSECACFEIEGYEKGTMTCRGVCSDVECSVLDQISVYMNGGKI